MFVCFLKCSYENRTGHKPKWTNLHTNKHKILKYNYKHFITCSELIKKLPKAKY